MPFEKPQAKYLKRSSRRVVIKAESFSYFTANYLDASAAVKLVIAERGSDHLNAYFANRSGFFITNFCLFEALSVLKRKMLKGKISRMQYFDECYSAAHLFANEAYSY
jgi:hypothetical protein